MIEESPLFLSKLELFNFRQFGSIGEHPGLSVAFHEGLNALIGENDSGKTAIVDAIKIVLLTQSNEFIRVVDSDFYVNKKESASELRIYLRFDGLTKEEAKNFIEYLTFSRSDKDGVKYHLNLFYRAWKDNGKIYSELKAGNANNGVRIEPKVRDLLRSVYLKPLRDAQHEMRLGRNSRISQILISHPIFNNNSQNKLVEILKQANKEIQNYFEAGEGNVILESVRKTLSELLVQDGKSHAEIVSAETKLKGILESLSLLNEEVNPGLGQLNLLFIAAELLLMRQDEEGALNLLLIEELEAHLHPQAQLRLIKYLQSEYKYSGVQIIISTHSAVLASKINLKNLILIKNKKGYDLSPSSTKLFKGDYLFLQRFLDATKANMFFAKGIIMVEGDAENLVIPTIAEIIGYPLEKYGISIVNVGSLSFLRYSRIFARANNEMIEVPVSVITDCDVKPCQNNNEIDMRKKAISDKEKKYSLGCIKGFISPYWTFEYCLALSSLSEVLHKAIYCAKKIENSDKYTLTKEKMSEIRQAIEQDKKKWEEAGASSEVRAFEMYNLMLDGSGKSKLKSIVAQCFATLLYLECLEMPDLDTYEDNVFDIDIINYKENSENKKHLKEKIFSDEYIGYIVKAIIHAAGADRDYPS